MGDDAGVSQDAAVISLMLQHPTLSNCVGDPAALRLATWNMRAARDSSLEAVAELLASVDADVIALQEVDLGVLRTGEVDQPRILAELLGYERVFAPSIEYMGGEYGLALLLRVPLMDVERRFVDNEGAYEPRIVLYATICAGGRAIRLVNHHADILPNTSERNLREILDTVRGEIGQGLVLMGDFNQLPEAPGLSALVDAGFTDVFAGSGEATTSDGRRIDYVLLDDLLALDLDDQRVVQTALSDHHLLWVDLDLAPR